MEEQNVPDVCTLSDLRRTMEVGFTRLDGKLDHYAGHLARTDADIERLSFRVAVLEKRVWTASGAAAFAGVAIPYLARVIGGG